MDTTTLHTDRMRRFQQAGLYLVTSQALSRGRSTLEIVDAALAGGVRLIQLREKEMPMPDFLRLAELLRARTAQAGALLIINDRVDVALAVGADGVHLGQEDLPITVARSLLPAGSVIGVSTHSLAEAREAERAGADYLGFGCMYSSPTKKDVTAPQGLERLREVTAAVGIPVVAIGGIGRDRLGEVKAGGAAAAAVISALAVADPEAAARELVAAFS